MAINELSYEIFKSEVIAILTKNPRGLTWTEIETALALNQELNNRWLRQLENETGLSKRKNEEGIIWYLPIKGVVYTMGYEGKTISQFVEKLKSIKIDQLIDVREIALSRKSGFAKTALMNALTENGIIYKHFPELGSPGEIRHKLHEDNNYNEFFSDYAAHLETEEPKKALSSVAELAQTHRTVIMCFEYNVAFCHRKIIKEHLIAEGFAAVDI